MTRLALVSPYTLPFSCGNSILAERLREGLIRMGYRVALFNSRENAPGVAAAFAPDILHTLNADRSYQWSGEFRATYKKIPWVITLTGTDYNTWCGIKEPPPHIRESLEQADALVVFHHYAAEALQSCFPSAGAKLHIIAQGVTPAVAGADRHAVRSRYGIDPDALVFLMVAGIRAVKNLGVAIEAFHEVERRWPAAALLLIGPVIDQSETERILALGSRLKCFKYLGEISPAEVRALMSAADVLLNTSRHEGMPGAVLEAMAAGLPILASFVAGNRALVRDGENGLLFPVDAVHDLVQAAVMLAQDGQLRARLGQTARRMAAVNYAVDREINRYQQLYARLIAG